MQQEKIHNIESKDRKLAQELDVIDPYDKMIQRSQSFSEKSYTYIHRPEFALICTKLEQQATLIQLVLVPIASGKSHLALFLSKMYPSSAIVVPSDHQRMQFYQLTLIDPKT